MSNAETILAVLIALVLLVVVAFVAPELLSQKTTVTQPIGPGPETRPPLEPTATEGKGVTVLVVIPETVLRQHVPDPAAETAAIRELILSNFRVVDQSQVKKIRYNDQVLLALHGDPEAQKAMQALALEYDADVLVLGEAFAEGPIPAPGGLQSARARVEIKALLSRTGEIIASEAVTQGGADVTFNIAAKMALQNGGQQIGKILVQWLERRFGQQPASQGKVELIVTSMPFKLYLLFKQKLENLPAVKGVIADHYTEKQSQVSVSYQGELMELASQILELELEGYRLEVLTYSNTRVTFKLVPKQGG